MKKSITQATRSWKDGADEGRYYVFRDNITFHESRRLIGPCFGLMEPSTQWVFEPCPNPKDEKLNAMAIGTRIHPILHTQGGTILGTRDDQGLLESAIVVREYDTSRKVTCWQKVKESFSFFAALIAIHRDTGLPPEFTSRKLKDARREVYERADILEEVYGDQHSKFGPIGPHWYICYVAVSPQSQGRGIGRGIMRRLGRAADEQQMPCYLETSSERNIRLYESVGYKVVSTCVLEDKRKTSSVSCVGMVREPQPIGSTT
jgi:ribosomal protein S18 acetylase RimI-like enzyme